MADSTLVSVSGVVGHAVLTKVGAMITNYVAIPAVALVCLVAPLPAWAGGIEYPDNGTVAIGRGGAWAANPSDGLAFQYNPAGLAQQRGWNLTLDARLANQQIKFTSTSIKGEPAQNSAPPFLSPSAAVSYGLGKLGPLSEFTIALGATGPSSIGISNWPQTGVQRYALRNTDYFIGFYSLALAGGIGDWLRFGVTGQIAQGSAKFNQAVWSDTFTGENPQVDTDATFSGKNSGQPTGVIGITVLPTPQWAIGLSWRPALHFAAPGTLVTVPPDAVKGDAKQVGDKAELRLAFADIVRLGVLHKPKPGWEVEANVVYERWSVLQEIRVHTLDVTVVPTADPTQSTKVPDIVFPHNFRDTVSLRLGGEHEIMPDRLTLRAGYIYETSAVPSEYVSVDFANWGRNVASVGASLRAFGASLDLAFAHHFIETQVVTDSKVEQKLTPPLYSFMTSPKPMIVGNGTYQASLDVVSLSLQVPFGSLKAGF